MLKPNSLRARNAIYLVAIITILSVFMLILEYIQYTSYQDPSYSEENVSLNDLVLGIIAIIYMIFYIISAVTFIQWFRRAYFNLHSQVEILSFDEGWAAGAWFVPIMNLGRPFKIMKEIYMVTNKLLDGHPNFSKQLNINNIVYWWMLWIISIIINQISFRTGLQATTVSQLSTSTIFDMLSSAITIPLGLITIKMIKEYSHIESILNADVSRANSKEDNLLDTPDLMR